METLNKKKKFFHMPHTYALIIGFIILAYLLTFVIPSGAYDRVTNPQTGVEMVDPDTYHKLQTDHLSPFDMVLAIPQGLEQAGYIIFFIFIIAGAFQVVTATGAIEAGIKKLAVMLQGKEILAIIIFTIAFSIGGATIGMSQETVIFIPIAIMLARSLGSVSYTHLRLSGTVSSRLALRLISVTDGRLSRDVPISAIWF